MKDREGKAKSHLLNETRTIFEAKKFFCFTSAMPRSNVATFQIEKQQQQQQQQHQHQQQQNQQQN